jgi:hypothetical protein
MKRSTIITLVLFSALLAGWMVMSRRPDKGEGSHLVSPRVKVSLADMDKLEIARPGKVKPVQYEADSFPMRSLVEKLADLDLGDIVTTNTSRHGEFEVGDDKAVVLTVWGGGQQKARLLVGKVSGPSTMTRLPGKPEVYATGGFVRSLVDKEVTVWRSKVITDVKREDLSEITVKTAAGQVVPPRPLPRRPRAATSRPPRSPPRRPGRSRSPRLRWRSLTSS